MPIICQDIDDALQAGWVGKGKDPYSPSRDYRSKPLSSLKDPALFGPPPKTVRYHGAEVEPSPSAPQDGESTEFATEKDGRCFQGDDVTQLEPKTIGPLPVPSRRDTGNSSPDIVPGVPAKRPTAKSELRADKPLPGGKPLLPPRLPPRRSSSVQMERAFVSENGGSIDPTATPVIPGQLNHGALHRLGKAGISVPALNIGPRSDVPASQMESPGDSTRPQGVRDPSSGAFGQLHTRFSKVPSSESTSSPTKGTSMAEKQSALRTMSSLHKDPRSVSLAETKAAVNTTNNFRQWHGAEVVQGYQAANSLNQQYGLVERANSSAAGASAMLNSVPATETALSTTKKPPPPPPKKFVASEQAIITRKAPPIPLDSKPK